MLLNDFWITDDGVFELVSAEHWSFAAGSMLWMPRNSHVPNSWMNKGVPEVELEKALARGADHAAVEFLAKGGDARLWVIREHGWIRTAKNKWNLWYFDKNTADLARSSTAYWRAQYAMDKKYEMLDVTELENGDRYSISVQKLLDGGKPQVLKNLAMGRTYIDEDESPEPAYSTAKYTEVERKRLRSITGDNPRRRR